VIAFNTNHISTVSSAVRAFLAVAFPAYITGTLASDIRTD
jgi:hypothetical protein